MRYMSGAIGESDNSVQSLDDIGLSKCHVSLCTYRGICLASSRKILSLSAKVQGGPEVRAVPFYFGLWCRIMSRIGDVRCLASCQYTAKLSDFWRENLARCLIS
jgi:hypothetical protein